MACIDTAGSISGEGSSGSVGSLGIDSISGFYTYDPNGIFRYR